MSDLRIPNLRTVTLAGRLGRAAELRYLPSGDAVCTLSVAVDLYRGKDKERDVLWLDCECFGKTAEVAAQCPKGAAILVEGNLDVARWIGKDGSDKEKVIVKAARVQRLEWDAKDGGNGGGEAKPAAKPQPAAARGRATVEEPEVGDDIPF